MDVNDFVNIYNSLNKVSKEIEDSKKELTNFVKKAKSEQKGNNNQKAPNVPVNGGQAQQQTTQQGNLAEALRRTYVALREGLQNNFARFWDIKNNKTLGKYNILGAAAMALKIEADSKAQQASVIPEGPELAQQAGKFGFTLGNNNSVKGPNGQVYYLGIAKGNGKVLGRAELQAAISQAQGVTGQKQSVTESKNYKFREFTNAAAEKALTQLPANWKKPTGKKSYRVTSPNGTVYDLDRENDDRKMLGRNGYYKAIAEASPVTSPIEEPVVNPVTNSQSNTDLTNGAPTGPATSPVNGTVVNNQDNTSLANDNSQTNSITNNAGQTQNNESGEYWLVDLQSRNSDTFKAIISQMDQADQSAANACISKQDFAGLKNLILQYGDDGQKAQLGLATPEEAQSTQPTEAPKPVQVQPPKGNLTEDYKAVDAAIQTIIQDPSLIQAAKTNKDVKKGMEKLGAMIEKDKKTKGIGGKIASAAGTFLGSFVGSMAASSDTSRG